MLTLQRRRRMVRRPRLQRPTEKRRDPVGLEGERRMPSRIRRLGPRKGLAAGLGVESSCLNKSDHKENYSSKRPTCIQRCISTTFYIVFYLPSGRNFLGRIEIGKVPFWGLTRDPSLLREELGSSHCPFSLLFRTFGHLWRLYFLCLVLPVS